MNDIEFVEELTRQAGEVPGKADVHELGRITMDDVHERMKRLLELVAEHLQFPPRFDLVREEDRSVMRLPLGAQLVSFHASGAVRFRSGLAPMDNLIGPERDKEELVRLVTSLAEQLRLSEWVGDGEELAFEKLWQIKAAGADRSVRASETVVCRAIGAFRHTIAGLPVWGSASAVVEMAGSSQLDAFGIFARPTSGRIVDTAAVTPPNVAATLVLKQLSALVPEGSFAAHAVPDSFKFGYVSLSKRQYQAFLAPAYVAEVHTEGDEPMSYLALVPGTEKEYLPMARVGAGPNGVRRKPAKGPNDRHGVKL
jgi:hypothetical protein